MIKTVEHDGKGLQIGQRYDFSDDGKSWFEFTFDGLTDNPARPYGADCNGWKLIRLINPSELGTITEAPLGLVHGAAYSFEYDGTSYVGLYSKVRNAFISLDGHSDLANVTKIKRLTVEIES